MHSIMKCSNLNIINGFSHRQNVITYRRDIQGCNKQFINYRITTTKYICYYNHTAISYTV